jgi:hypothetical protein
MLKKGQKNNKDWGYSWVVVCLLSTL